jgi:hypothetical protein
MDYPMHGERRGGHHPIAFILAWATLREGIAQLEKRLRPIYENQFLFSTKRPLSPTRFIE